MIDASTAHRTEPGWCYGLPELGESFLEKLKTSKRTAVPGCHASGFISLVYPLIAAGILPADADITCHSITGYSGGGKKMIAQYEEDGRDALLDAPRQYGLTQKHKHLKEMKAISGINNEPVFCPIVADFYSGMEVTVPLFAQNLNKDKTVSDIKNAYKEKYRGPVVTYKESIDEDGFVSAVGLGGKDTIEISVCGNDDRILLVARYDNLGKGASGAAVECLNIVIGADKTKCLDI